MHGFSSRPARLLLAIMVLSSCVGCDQATKRIARQNLRDTGPYSYLANTLRLEYAENPGGFLSLGSRVPPGLRFWLFTVLNMAMLVGVTWFLATRWNMRLGAYLPMLLVVAGGIGNLIDRVLYDGLVTDFIVVDLGLVRTGIFNVADMALTCGGVLFAMLYRFDPEEARRSTS